MVCPYSERNKPPAGMKQFYVFRFSLYYFSFFSLSSIFLNSSSVKIINPTSTSKMQANRIDSIIYNSVLCGRLALFECIIATVAAAAIAPLGLIIIACLLQ